MKTRPCTDCGRPIWFGVNRRTGRSIPMDQNPVVVYHLSEASRTDPDEPRVVGRPAYLSHYETCPQRKPTT